MAWIFKRNKKELPQYAEIGQNSLFEGEINSKNLLIINGIVKGIVKSEISVETGEKSQLDGKLICHRATIKGSFKGDIETENVLISGSAKVEGQIRTKKMEVEKGAEINGRIL